jgi:hypothetical protein
MNVVLMIVFFGWIPMIFGIFAALPPRKAVIASYVVGWLLLPPISFGLPGLPDYSKITATNYGVLLATLTFDLDALLRLRFKLFDLPMLAWCVAPFCTSISNDLGIYDGVSTACIQVALWAVPYILGRAYLVDPAAMRELALGMVVGGLVLIPLCFIEMRMSNVLITWVYGIPRYSNSFRMGAYRPQIFMWNGLELGMWMSGVSLIGFWLWLAGGVRVMRGQPFGWLVAALIVTAVLCRSLGAVLLMTVGLAALYGATLGRGRSWLLWALLAVVPLYVTTRLTGVWAAEEPVWISRALFGEERTESLEYRFINEEFLVDHAMERPIHGWGGFNRATRYFEKIGRNAVSDGLWIIALTWYGIFGLTALVGVLCLPPALILWRFPVQRWRDEDIAAVGALATLLMLTAVDDLSNAMVNPIYTLAGGGLLSIFQYHRPGRPSDRKGRRGDRREEAADRLAARADVLSGVRPAEARAACEQGIALREAMIAERPRDRSARRDLAREYGRLGRIVARGGSPRESEPARRRSLELWETLEAEAPDDAEARFRRAEAQNDLAWAICAGPGREADEVAEAIRLAATALEQAPDDPAFWNTLGAARYRAGEWAAAIAALERSAHLGVGNSPFHLFIHAMAAARAGDGRRGSELLARAVEGARREAPGHAGLARLRTEAEAVVHGAVAPS